MAAGRLERTLDWYTRGVRGLVQALLAVAAAGILVMTAVTCADVVLRLFRLSFTGAYDVVKIAGAITMASALPYTAAVGGNVAIEYFHRKLGRRGRRWLSVGVALLGMVLFGCLAWQSVQYGLTLKANRQVTQTLEAPLFWVPWVLAFCSAVSALVLLHQLARPESELVKP